MMNTVIAHTGGMLILAEGHKSMRQCIGFHVIGYDMFHDAALRVIECSGVGLHALGEWEIICGEIADVLADRFSDFEWTHTNVWDYLIDGGVKSVEFAGVKLELPVDLDERGWGHATARRVRRLTEFWGQHPG